MKYHLITYGCQMNRSDSERLMRVLDDLGYKKTSEENEADLLIINACSVRQTAIDRIHGKFKKWKKLKEKSSKIKTILTGCVLEADKKKLGSQFDLVFNIKELNRLSGAIEDLNKKCVHRIPSKNYFKIKPKFKSKVSASVPIMTGCDNFCSYCAVPYTRGRETSRSVKEIIEEIKGLLDEGYRDFLLLGQNVNSYRSGKTNFVGLLKKICALSGDFYIKFYSNHPKDFSRELIDLMAQEEKIVKYVHLPLQAGSDEILKKMNRKYTKKDYLKLAQEIRKKIPGVILTTDAIVGFPGETKSQFRETVEVFKKVKFDMAYTAKFSPRAGTVATKLKDNISPLEKKRREYILNEILTKSSLESNQKFIGKTVKAVIRKKLENDLWQAETLALKPIQFRARGDFKAKIVDLEVIRAGEWNFGGKLK